MGKSEGNSENWLVTYGDLMTLLLVFFVLLYTLMDVDVGKFDSFVSYFKNSSSFFEDNNMKKEDYEEISTEDAAELLEERMEYWQEFADFLEESEMSSDVNMEMTSSGVKITLSDSLTFESGSSELLSMAEVVLSEVAQKIDNQIQEIEVQGHTDNVPIRGSSMYKSNWHLGAARAVSVVLFLNQNSSVDPERFKASSFGEYTPVAENETEEGRKKNRRVEIYLRDQVLVDNNFKKTDFWF